MTETHHTFCRICESLCGLEVTTNEGRVVQIRPDKDHVATDGYGCVKGLKQHKMYDSPDRLKYPLKRVGNKFERISWEQALSEIGAKVAQLRGIHPDSIAMYVGTAAGFGVLHPVFAAGFIPAVLALVPLVNLTVPLFSTSYFVHIFKRVKRSSA